MFHLYHESFLTRHKTKILIITAAVVVTLLSATVIALAVVYGSQSTPQTQQTDSLFTPEQKALWFNDTSELNITDQDPEVVSAAIRDAIVLWDQGIVPYTLDGVRSVDVRNNILQAIESFHSLTCLKFVKRTTQRAYLRFIDDRDKPACGSAHIGETSLPGQPVHIHPSCIDDLSTSLHEIGHAIGMIHEHTREDRDQYVILDQAAYFRIYGDSQATRDNWRINYGIEKTQLRSDYDYGSVMHYPAFEFLRARRSGVRLSGTKLSQSDVNIIRQLYKCGQGTSPSTSVEFRPGSFSKWSMNCDFPGNDLGYIKVPGSECSWYCNYYRSNGCTHFSYWDGVCYLKKGALPQFYQPKPGCVCGWWVDSATSQASGNIHLPSHEVGNERCGTSWDDANEKCSDPCYTSSDCQSGQYCYQGLHNCFHDQNTTTANLTEFGNVTHPPTNSSTFRCGISWSDAQNNCFQACPSGLDYECTTSGEKCFSNLSPCSTPSSKTRCGTTWTDANSTCGTPCPSGQDSECTFPEKCFRDLSAC